VLDGPRESFHEQINKFRSNRIPGMRADMDIRTLGVESILSEAAFLLHTEPLFCLPSTFPSHRYFRSRKAQTLDIQHGGGVRHSLHAPNKHEMLLLPL